MTETVKLGGIYTGKVVRVADFGAFVEILPGQDGMVHISQLDSQRVERVEDVARMGDELTVMVTGIENGKVRLSRQAVLEGWSLEEAQSRDRKPGGGGGGRGGDRDRERGGDRGRGGERGGRGSFRGGRGGDRN
jgi:polyribonucleotide nucleotidyltransferase